MASVANFAGVYHILGMAKRKMSLKRRQWCDRYHATGNALQSARDVGYAEATALTSSRWLKEPPVIAYLEALEADRQERDETLEEYVLKGFMEIHQRCMQRVPVLDNEGNETGKWTFQPGPANVALTQLGKTRRMFVDRVDHSGQVSLEQIVGGAGADKE
jgi:phage terminase small subunit